MSIRKQKPIKREDPRDVTRINEQIREREIRLIDENGEHTGIITVDEAQKRAIAAGLDLVEVSAKSKPHVCRIMDYGQYRYELAKKQKEAKKKQKLIVVKEIKLRPRIEQHDYEFKLKYAIKFLDHGDKVKFILQFRGRENAHKELGRIVLDRVIADLQDYGLVEQPPQTEGRFMNMTIAPLSAAQRKKIRDDKKLTSGSLLEPKFIAPILPVFEEEPATGMDEDLEDELYDDTDDTDLAEEMDDPSFDDNEEER